MDRDEKIGDELHLRSGPEGAEMDRLAREVGEDAETTLAEILVAADIEHDIASRRLRAGAAYRRVKHRDSGSGKPIEFTLLASERQGAELDERLARSSRSLKDAIDDRSQSVLSRETGQKQIRLFRRRLD